MAVSEIDLVWGQYMERRRDWRELVTLLGDEEVLSEYHHRVLQVLLAPEIKRLPFLVNTDSFPPNNYLGVNVDWRGTLKGDLPVQAAKLVETYIVQLKRGTPKEDEDRRVRSLGSYNGLIRQLLPILPSDQAEKLFAHFQLLDSSLCTDPISVLYRDQGIDESWKRRAAALIHPALRPGDKSLDRYSEIFSLMLYGEKLPISKGFYQDEIAFLLGLGTGKPIIGTYNPLGRILDLLEDSEVRHKFARRHVLTGGEPGDSHRFTVSGNERAIAARRIIADFPEDQELTSYLQWQLAQWQIRSEQEQLRNEQLAKTEEEIATRMRKPQAVS